MTKDKNKSIAIAEKMLVFDGKSIMPANPFPDEPKLVRILLFFMGMSVPQIAKEVGVTPGFCFQFVQGTAKSKRLYDYFQKLGINLNREGY